MLLFRGSLLRGWMNWCHVKVILSALQLLLWPGPLVLRRAWLGTRCVVLSVPAVFVTLIFTIMNNSQGWLCGPHILFFLVISKIGCYKKLPILATTTAWRNKSIFTGKIHLWGYIPMFIYSCIYTIVIWKDLLRVILCMYFISFIHLFKVNYGILTTCSLFFKGSSPRFLPFFFF